MRDVKSKAQFVSTSITMRSGLREEVDSLCKRIKKETGLDATRSKLISALAELAIECSAEIDLDKIRDDATFKRELGRSLARKNLHLLKPPTGE